MIILRRISLIQSRRNLGRNKNMEFMEMEIEEKKKKFYFPYANEKN